MNEFIAERYKFFSDNYEVIVDYNLLNEKIFIGNKDKRKCRFCSRSKPEVSFKKVAHAIPELIGNKVLFSYEECDDCNEKFSKTLEDHLAKFLILERTLSQIRGKNGVPTFKTKKKKSRIGMENNSFKIENYENDPIVELNEESHELTVKYTRGNHIPLAVYKCFTKMALSIMPGDELSFFTDTIKWINESHDSKKFTIKPLFLFGSFSPGPNPFSFIKILLFRRKNNHTDNVPYMLMNCAFYNYFYQISIPFNKKDKIFENLKYAYFPTPPEMDNRYGETIYFQIDLSSNKIEKNKEYSITFHFDELEKVESN